MLLGQPSHDGSRLYVPEPAPALGQTVPVFLRAPASSGIRRVWVRTTPDAEPRFVEATVDRRDAVDRWDDQVTWWRAPVEVRNPLTPYRFFLETVAGPRWFNALGLFSHDVPDATDFRLVAWDPPPSWALDAVVYQIFPDRFARSAAAGDRGLPDWAVPCDWDTPVIGQGPETPYQFYGGDLDGIVERLDHIEALGANTLYLTPIFPGRSNHRYDASSFTQVDPLLGGDVALARLAAAAKGRGMRLLGDLTTNHCGSAHPWFVAAAGGDGAPEREMFYFHNGLSADGLSADGASDGYESWCGVSSLPKLNWASDELRRRFADGPDSVVRRWLSPPYDLDGWRIDVANMTGRRGADSHTHTVATLLRSAAVRARRDALLVAEHAHDATGDLDRDGWHATMNYAGFTRPMWSWLRSDSLALTHFLGVPGGVPRHGGGAAVATMRWFGAHMSWRSLTHSWTLLGSHDTARIRTVVGDRARVEIALGLQMTLPGVPMVFAGDEIGLEGVNGEDARRPMPWHRRNDWDRSTLDTYRALIRVRRGSAALRHGGLRWAYHDDETIAFLRETVDETLLVYARRAPGDERALDEPGWPGRGVSVENIYGGVEAAVGPDGCLRLPGDGPTIQIWRLHSAR